MANRLLVALFISTLLVFNAAAATVSFLVIETGLEAEEELRQHSDLWESGLLDVFFDSGHIVSNAPILRIYSKSAGDFPNEARPDFNDAIEGGVEYFITATLDYEAAQTLPANVAVRIFRVSPYRKIHEQQYRSLGQTSTVQEEYDSIKAIVRGIVPHVNNR
ncbi:MAG: hypothetical protein FWG99_00865 [Treponema sp.]|nr:hypothetical protein [Treponema sp.]